MSPSIIANRIWALFMIVLITTTGIIVLRMVGLYEGFDASMAEAFESLGTAPEGSRRASKDSRSGEGDNQPLKK